MENLVKLRVFGSEIYTVRKVHVVKGEHVIAGQNLLTISSGNTVVQVTAEDSFVVMDVLVRERDHVKASNAMLSVLHNAVHYDFMDRRAAGY